MLRWQTKSKNDCLRRIYTAFFYLAYPWLRWTFSATWRARLGHYQEPALSKSVWFHAASVGEVKLALQLITAFRLRRPQVPIVLTTMTEDGAAVARKQLPPGVVLTPLPLDLFFAIDRFLQHFQPEQAVLLETELWPNLLLRVHQKRIRLLLTNARLSPRSMRHYRKISGFMGWLLGTFDEILAQSESDAQRFRELGALDAKLQVVGNIKFDGYDLHDPKQMGQLKTQLGASRPVLLAASTHPGEEALVVAAYKQIQQQVPNLLLILAPRHLERAEVVGHLLTTAGLQWTPRTRFTATDTLSEATNVFLLDTLGELASFYSVADVSFVGGSLVNIGGHNLVEAVVCGMPVITGPYTQNCAEMRQLLEGAGLVTGVDSAQTLAERVSGFLKNAQTTNRAERLLRLEQVLGAHRGALQRHLERIVQP